jgi:hypothetical protein
MGAWFMGEQARGPWRGMPITIFNTKNDELLNELPARELSIKDKPPKHGGLYMVRPRPEDDDAAVQKYLQGVWDNEDHALYFDEGYMLGNKNRAFRLLLTQGRAKHIPMTYLSQRPVFMDRFAFSEARYFALFHLVDNRDIKTVQEFVSVPVSKKLAKHHFVWYDVNSDAGAIVKPVPSPETIINGFNSHFPKPRSFF